MLKHVQISPLRNRADSVSLRSSTSCASSICGSPEPLQPTELQRTPSRASSYSSLNEQLPQTTIKVYTSCLKIDIEYKTLGIQWDTTSKEVITQLLRRLKMRHRDPRLFYLSMEVLVRKAGVKTILVLDDDTRPAILQACHPKGESRFCLQLKPGGLIRVHTSALQPNSQYKSLVISEETTSDELLQLLLSCYNSMEPVEQFSIYEVCPGQEYQRKLHPDDIPLRAQSERMKRGETCHFLVRRNPTYARRRQLLNTLNEVVQTYQQQPLPNVSNKSFDVNSTISSLDDIDVDDDDDDGIDEVDGHSLLDVSIDSLTDDFHSIMTTTTTTTSTARTSDFEDCEDCGSSTSGSSDTSSEGSTTVRRTPSTLSIASLKKLSQQQSKQQQQQKQQSVAATLAKTSNAQYDLAFCSKCRNSFKSCEFCHKNSTMMTALPLRQQQNHEQQHQQQQQQQQLLATSCHVNLPTTSLLKPLQLQHLPAYNPVYNIREIRTATHSFSSLGNDKKLLDIQLNGQFDVNSCRLRPQSVFMARSTRMLTDGNANRETLTPAAVEAATKVSDFNGNFDGNVSSLTAEAVNNNPAKGLGHFVYL